MLVAPCSALSLCAPTWRRFVIVANDQLPQVEANPSDNEVLQALRDTLLNRFGGPGTMIELGRRFRSPRCPARVRQSRLLSDFCATNFLRGVQAL